MLWGLPIVLFLALNENWIEKDKWEIVIMTYLPLYLAAGYGVHWLFAQKSFLRMSLIWGLTLVAVLGARDLMLRIEAPADQRLFDVYADKGRPLLEEDQAYVELEKMSFYDLDWWPSHHRQVQKRLKATLNPHPMLRRVEAIKEELQALHPDHRLGKKPSLKSVGLPEYSVTPFDVSVPPHNGLDPISRKPMGRHGCNPGASFVQIDADMPGKAVEVIWNDQPLIVTLRTMADQRMALLELERRSRQEAQSPVSSQCLHLMVPKGYALLIDDRVSIEPSRVYSYQLREVIEYPGWSYLTLLGE
jgi:hypothetical protein